VPNLCSVAVLSKDRTPGHTSCDSILSLIASSRPLRLTVTTILCFIHTHLYLLHSTNQNTNAHNRCVEFACSTSSVGLLGRVRVHRCTKVSSNLFIILFLTCITDGVKLVRSSGTASTFTAAKLILLTPTRTLPPQPTATFYIYHYHLHSTPLLLHGNSSIVLTPHLAQLSLGIL
jgi:hypothetical protein